MHEARRNRCAPAVSLFLSHVGLMQMGYETNGRCKKPLCRSDFFDFCLMPHVNDCFSLLRMY